MPTNRELLIAQRKRETSGLPSSTKKKAVVSQTKRGAGPTGKGFTGKTGKSASLRRGKKLIKEQPEAVEGIGLARPKGFGEGITSPEEDAIEAAKVSSVTKSITPGVESTSGLPATLEEFKAGTPDEGTMTAIERATSAKQGTGGFVFHEPTKGGGAPKPVFKSGLPTDRLPSFSELGGAIGSVFKFVSDLSKFNRARGLVPGTDAARVKKSATTGGLKAKDILSTLTKQQETAILSGNKDMADSLGKKIDAIIAGKDAGSFERQSDTEAILND